MERERRGPLKGAETSTSSSGDQRLLETGPRVYFCFVLDTLSEIELTPTATRGKFLNSMVTELKVKKI